MAELLNMSTASWRRQPSGGRVLNRYHPLSTGLAALVDLSAPVELVNNALCPVVKTKRVVTARGVVSGFGSSLGVDTTDSVSFQIPSGSLAQRSILAIVLRNGPGGSGLGRIVVGAGFSLFNSDTSYFISNYFSTSGLNETIARQGDGTWIRLVVTYDGSSTSNRSKVYYNGVSAGYTAIDLEASGTIVNGAGAYSIGNNFIGTRNWDGLIQLVAIWSRVLSAEEVKSVSENPWQLFAPAPFRFYSIPSGASSYQLVSSFASTSSSSAAALNIQRILASTCASLSSTSSIALVSLIPLLSALTSASETATSAWQVLRVLQSTLASDSSTSPAALAIERALLSALTSASLSTTSALNVQRNFLTALSSDSSAPAITLSIAGLLALLSALSSQSSTAASALDVQRALLSALTSQSATGDITLNTETLIALLSAVASTSLSSASALNITRSLATAINSPSSTATAALPVQRPLTTGLNAQSNTSISVLELINLIGLASTVSSQSSTSTAIANLARALVSELLSASSTATIPLPVLRDLAVTLVSASLTDAIDLSLTMLGQIDLVSLIESTSLTNPQVRLLADLVAAIQGEMKVQMTGVAPSFTMSGSVPSIAVNRI